MFRIQPSIYSAGFALIGVLALLTPVANGQNLYSTDYDLSQTFLLHSNPNSTKKLFLDFDGFDGYYHNYNEWDMDNTPGVFSDAEKTRIHEVWQSVAEDFLPFDIDVTTQDPGEAGLSKNFGNDQTYGTRVVIDGNGSYFRLQGGTDGEGTGANGSSYYDYSWNDNRFNDNGDYEDYVYPNDHSWAWIADSVSHEAGHALNLDHDGGGGDGEYWYGHGTVGTETSYYSPIMGWTRTQLPTGVSQWSQGEYNGANNDEDDLHIITTQNGTPFRSDDHGSTINSATVLTEGVMAQGIIEQRTDLDFFSFSVDQNSDVQLDINPAVIGANLDILAKLYDDQGVELLESNPADFLNASFTTTLDAGEYFLSIDGTGFGNPATNGYSDYGSLGFFSIELSVTPNALQGDFNGDGTVDLADYTLWRNNLGGDESSINSAGDGENGVDAADYALWKQNFGTSAASSIGVTAVPEPKSSLTAIVLLSFALFLARLSAAKSCPTL